MCSNIERRASRAARGFSARTLVAAASMFVVIGIAAPRAQFERSISTTFDGWKKHADGSYELVFGYMNRNAGEVDVPPGADNRIEPAAGELPSLPTHFLPGRQRAIFTVDVPAGFKGKYVWTLTYAGTTQTATASIDQNYSLDVGDPEPPGVTAPPPLSIRIAEAAQLKPVITPAPVAEVVPGADVVPRRAAGGRVTVWWSEYSGPGTVTFGDGKPTVAAPPNARESALGSFRVTCASAREAGCGATSAHFSSPGTYLLRVVAAERSASMATVKVLVNP
jgi:hypothetical protein